MSSKVTKVVETNIKRTKLTEKANLLFNVNLYKKWLVNFYKQNNMTTDSDNNSIPKLNGIHVAFAAVSQVLCDVVLNESITHLSSENSGLFNISRPAIRYAVLLNSDLRHLFVRSMEKFDKDMIYDDQYCLPKKEVLQFIEHTMGKNIISLDNKAYNLLAYLLLKFNMELATNIYNMMLYAKKRSLGFKSIIYAVKNLCNGELQNKLLLKLNDTMKLIVSVKQDDTNQENNDDNDNDNDDDDNDDESDSDNNSDNDDDDNNDENNSDSEEEEEEKPVVKKKVVKKKVQVKKRVPKGRVKKAK
jgi:hypothetical protein